MSVIGHTPRPIFPSKSLRDGLGSTDLLVCIGEMCATASLAKSDMMDMVVGIRDTTVTAQLPS